MGPQASVVRRLRSWPRFLAVRDRRAHACPRLPTVQPVLVENSEGSLQRVRRYPVSFFLPYVLFSSIPSSHLSFYSACPIPSLLLYSLFFLSALKMLHLENIPISKAVKVMTKHTRNFTANPHLFHLEQCRCTPCGQCLVSRALGQGGKYTKVNKDLRSGHTHPFFSALKRTCNFLYTHLFSHNPEPFCAPGPRLGPKTQT